MPGSWLSFEALLLSSDKPVRCPLWVKAGLSRYVPRMSALPPASGRQKEGRATGVQSDRGRDQLTPCPAQPQGPSRATGQAGGFIDRATLHIRC